MIEIDGCVGGGQLLRTSLSLSVITGKAFKIKNIRSTRDQPGLKNQHLTCVRAAKEICDAEVKGNDLGSKELEFIPNKIKNCEFKFNVGTAGSTSLVAQTLLPVFLFYKKKTRLEISGGTETMACPPSYDFENLFLYFLSKFGADVEFEIVKHGFFPKGGGKIILEINKSEIEPIVITARGDLKEVKVVAIASKELKKVNVATRLISGFKKYTYLNHEIEEIRDYVDTFSIGCFIQAYAGFENTRIGLTVLGERNKTSEEIGKKCAEGLKKELENGFSVDKYTADQLLIYLALYGGSINADITDHVRTNIEIIEKFLDVKFKIEGNKISVK